MLKSLLTALVAASMGVIPVASPAPPAAAGTVSVEVCVPALSGNDTICGQPVPQGAPWILYRVEGLGRGEPVDVNADCIWVNSRVANHWCFNTIVTNNGWEAGEHLVTVRDAATGKVLSTTTYSVTPQSPDDALAAYRSGANTFAKSAVVLALAREGQLDQALETAQAMARSSNPDDQYEAQGLEFHVLMALHRPADALVAAQSRIAWRHQHNQQPSAQDYVQVAQAAIAACEIPTAEQALGQASLLAPADPQVTRLLVEAEEARANCGTLPPSSPGGGESQ